METNKLTNCKACGAQVAKTAKTCPHCGAKVKKGHPVLIGVLVVIILFAVIGAVGSSNEPKKVETPTKSEQQYHIHKSARTNYYKSARADHSSEKNRENSVSRW